VYVFVAVWFTVVFCPLMMLAGGPPFVLNVALQSELLPQNCALRTV
jgi:hypothetical protein